MKKQDEFFQMVIVPTKTDLSNLKAYLDALQNENKDFRYELDTKNNMLDFWYKNFHLLIRTDVRNYTSFMNFVEGFIQGVLYETQNK